MRTQVVQPLFESSSSKYLSCFYALWNVYVRLSSHKKLSSLRNLSLWKKGKLLGASHSRNVVSVVSLGVCASPTTIAFRFKLTGFENLKAFFAHGNEFTQVARSNVADIYEFEIPVCNWQPSLLFVLQTSFDHTFVFSPLQLDVFFQLHLKFLTLGSTLVRELSSTLKMHSKGSDFSVYYSHQESFLIVCAATAMPNQLLLNMMSDTFNENPQLVAFSTDGVLLDSCGSPFFLEIFPPSGIETHLFGPPPPACFCIRQNHFEPALQAFSNKPIVKTYAQLFYKFFASAEFVTQHVSLVCYVVPCSNTRQNLEAWKAFVANSNAAQFRELTQRGYFPIPIENWAPSVITGRNFARIESRSAFLEPEKFFGKENSVPVISIVVPNRNSIEFLKTCVESILTKSSFQNFELIIVENNSTDVTLFSYYKFLEASDARVKIVTWNLPFNYSAINNFAVAHAKGEYVVFLNNDMELITPLWLEHLLVFASRREVGAVGARLLYADHSFQHVGVVLGQGGVAGHVHHQEDAQFLGWNERIQFVQNQAAVTAACLMMRKSIFDKIGGFDPRYAVAFNDVDLCLRILATGVRIVWTPQVELFHYESKSRGEEDTPEKLARFASEVNRFLDSHSELLACGDPYHSPVFSLKTPFTDFAL